MGCGYGAQCCFVFISNTWQHGKQLLETGVIMLRLILFIISTLILYAILHLLIKDMPSIRKRVNRRVEPEELVQDPYCLTYIPKRLAIKKNVAGKECYFCNRNCLENYLKNGMREKG